MSGAALALTGCVPWGGNGQQPTSTVVPLPQAPQNGQPAQAPNAVDPVVATKAGNIRVTFFGDHVAQVRVRPDTTFDQEFSYAVAQLPAPTACTRSDQGDSTTFAGGDLAITVGADGTLSVARADGTPVLAKTSVKLGDQSHLSWALEKGETLHGLGARAFGLDLRGRNYVLWNTDARSYYPEDDPLYLSIPFLLGVRKKLSYAVLWDNSARGTVDAGKKADRVDFMGTAGELRFYVIAADHPEQVLSEYANLTGTAFLPPIWAMGYHQSRWSYKTAAEFTALAARMRADKIPCDALYFDIDYLSGYRCFTWDRSAFPNMAKLQKTLHGQGFHTVSILDPGVKVDASYDVYTQGHKKGYFLQDPDGGELHRPVWPGDCAFPDFTDPKVRSWWSGRVSALVGDAGFDGLWNDMNEPSVMVDQKGVTLPDSTRHDCDGHPATSADGGHNVYGMQMAKATFDGLTDGRKKSRPFNISRSGYAGLARHATNWTGDNRSSWEHLRLSITMVLNLGLCGVPFTGPDIGGFRGSPDAELMTRWLEAASMLPFFRNHAARDAAYREPWRFGTAAEKNIRADIERRYQLLGYLYSEYAQGIRAGLPLARPVFFDDPADSALRAVEDEFLVGSQMLSAPVVTRGAKSREVRLPKGDWYGFDGQPYPGGGQVRVDAPLGELPLFVRAGAVVPQWPVRQHTGERLRSVTLHAYWGEGSSVWYEDAGDGYGYQKGESRTSTFKVSASAGTLTRSVDGSFDPGYKTVSVAVHGVGDRPQSVRVDGKTVEFTVKSGTLLFDAGDFGEVSIA